MITKPQITVADLYQVPDKGKAELVNGELVRQMPTGGIPGRAARYTAAWKITSV